MMMALHQVAKKTTPRKRWGKTKEKRQKKTSKFEEKS